MIYVSHRHGPEVRNQDTRSLKCSIAIAESLNQVVSAGFESDVCIEADKKIEFPIVVEINGEELLRGLSAQHRKQLRRQLSKGSVSVTEKHIKFPFFSSRIRSHYSEIQLSVLVEVPSHQV